jgi:hypothetical protein
MEPLIKPFGKAHHDIRTFLEQIPKYSLWMKINMLLKSINIHDQQVKFRKIFSELARILIQLFLHTIVNYYWLLNP